MYSKLVGDMPLLAINGKTVHFIDYTLPIND